MLWVDPRSMRSADGAFAILSGKDYTTVTLNPKPQTHPANRSMERSGSDAVDRRFQSAETGFVSRRKHQSD